MAGHMKEKAGPENTKKWSRRSKKQADTHTQEVSLLLTTVLCLKCSLVLTTNTVGVTQKKKAQIPEWDFTPTETTKSSQFATHKKHFVPTKVLFVKL